MALALPFFDQLTLAAEQQGSLLCVGLDPRPSRFPPEVLAEPDSIFAFNRQIIDVTRDLVCAYKPNYAFYEAHGLPGLRALRETIEYIGSSVPVILDAKRGDIGSTATAYARAAYQIWGAGAVTVAPYLGADSVTPFTDYADHGVFVLCHTSNPSASDLQGLVCDGSPLYEHVAHMAQGWSDTENVGLVVGATYPEMLKDVREWAPDAWILVPGIGAQGGDLDATIEAGLRPDGLGLAISVSRGVCHADDPRAAAQQFRDQINAARDRAIVRKQAVAHQRITTGTTTAGGSNAQAVPPIGLDPRTALILDLAQVGAVRFGQFTLKSGKVSPIYIDLRLLASHPDLLRRAAVAYAGLLRGLDFARIAAIPYAALPIGTAVALHTGRPLIYPRKEVKGYGTRRAIEGRFQAGERVVVLDDLITTGGSKIEAIAPLEQAGLEVRDIVVLIDRESGGFEALQEAGYRLHAVLTLRQILDTLAQHAIISPEQRQEVLDWLIT
jgi:uridine monophosphate synthetase